MVKQGMQNWLVKFDIILGTNGYVVLDIGLYVGDGVSVTKFSSGSLTAKGVGSNEAKAYINAFKQIRPENKDFKAVIDAAKPKILEYHQHRHHR